MKEEFLINLQEPRLVLFDMDGVLFDTMPTHAKSWKETVDHYKITAEEKEFYLYEGMKGRDTIAHLYNRTYGENPLEELIDEIYDYKCDLFNEKQTGETPRIAGTLELMAYLANERKCDIAVVTGSTVRNAHHRIEKYYSEFVPLEHVIAAENVTHGKPHPEPYLRGMQLFNRKPEETMVVENAPLGVRSGADSGALTAAVLTGPVPEHYLRAEGASLIFPNMRALHLWWKFSFEGK